MAAPDQDQTNMGGGLGLEFRLMLFVVCLVTIIAGVASTIVIATERDARIAHFSHSAAAKAGVTVAHHVEALTKAEPNAVVAALDAMVRESWIDRAEVYDAAGALIAARAEDRARDALPAPDEVRAAIGERAPVSRASERWMSVVTPIIRSGQVAAAARLIIDRESLPAAPGSAFGGLLFAYALGLLLGVPLAILIARRITRPLKQLTAFSKSLTTQGSAEPIELRTGDEFETLAGAFNGMIARFDDSMRRIERLAYRDPATDLPNAAGAQKMIAEQVAASKALRESGVVFVLRVERLDSLVEMIGTERAQDLVATISARLRARVKSIDQSVRITRASERPSLLSRLNSADFCVIAPSFDNGADAARFAQRLAAALSQPIEWREQTFSFGGRVGAAVFPRDGEDPDALIRHALLAVSAAGAEPGRARFFAREMERTAARRLAAEREIRHGIDQRAFVAHFQPKVDLVTRRVIGAEALARWIQPNGAIVSPVRFIGPAEEFGLIGPISEAILTDACWKAAAWAREGEGVKVAVNVSPLQLVDDKFTDRILRVLLETGLAPELLELEITESVALSNPERANALINPLKDIGVSVALDDFGCGHSSLASLSKLPFDVVKIDQSFVRALAHDPHAGAIIETIITLATRLGCSVVAEGVESEVEADWLLRRGCPVAQGFLFGPALPPLDFRRMQFSGPRDDAAAATRVA